MDEISNFTEKYTKKKLKFVSDGSLSQEAKYLLIKDDYEAIHETCHYLVSSFKSRPNLGFENYKKGNSKLDEILEQDELNAVYLNSLILFKLLKNSNNLDSKTQKIAFSAKSEVQKVNDYSKYLMNISKNGFDTSPHKHQKRNIQKVNQIWKELKKDEFFTKYNLK